MSATSSAVTKVCIRVPDLSPEPDLNLSGQSTERARWCCQQLEDGRVLLFETLPFVLPETERRFLLSLRWDDSALHKNVSYRPGQDLLRGFSGESAAATDRVHRFMRQYSIEALKFLAQLLSPYAPHWLVDYASFRPLAEENRKLPTRKRNDLLHVDAFPSRPTRGGRILRCFTNMHPTQPRIWQTTDGFAVLADKYAREARLSQFTSESYVRALGRTIKQSLGLVPKGQTAYDRFMLGFHDFLKENQEFQQNCQKIRIEFPPGSTWICFTDAVPHAVLYGQYALEQTVIVPLNAMLSPDKSPLRVLETISGKAMVETNSAAFGVARPSGNEPASPVPERSQ